MSSRKICLVGVFFCLTQAARAAEDPAWGSTPTWTPPSGAVETPAVEGAGTSRHRRASRDIESNGPFSPNSHNIALNLGQVFLMGNLTEKYSDNLGTQLSYTYGVSDILGFHSSIGYSEHSEGQFSLLSAVAGIRTNLNWYDKVVPNATVGLGFYRPSYQLTPTTSLAPILFGMHLGVGADLVMTKQIFFGAALTFNDIFSNTRQLPSGSFEVGGTYISFNLRAGVTF